MTQDILTAAGEEYLAKIEDGTLTDLGTDSLTVGIYNDSTDNITDSNYDPASAITTEPTNADYATNSINVSAAETSTDVWGLENDGSFTFDFSDQTTSEDVDTFYITANFNSTEAGGSGDWIIATAGMTQTRDIGSIDTIDVSAGDIELNHE